jgi:hypothetical protein
MAASSIRWHPNNLDTVDAAILKTNSIISNRAKILTFIKMNCTKLLIQFPELEALPDIDLCNRYQFSRKFNKVVVIISTLYDTYLPYSLYGPPILPVIISALTSLILFSTNYVTNEFIIQWLELAVVLCGFLIIILHYFFPDFDGTLAAKFSSLKNF